MLGGAQHIQIDARGLVDPFVVARGDHGNLPDGAGSTTRGEGLRAPHPSLDRSSSPPERVAIGAGTFSRVLAPPTYQQVGHAFAKREGRVDARSVCDLVQARRASELPCHLAVTPCGDRELNCERPGALTPGAVFDRPHDAPSLVKPACLTTGRMTQTRNGVAFQRNPEMNRHA